MRRLINSPFNYNYDCFVLESQLLRVVFRMKTRLCQSVYVFIKLCQLVASRFRVLSARVWFGVDSLKGGRHTLPTNDLVDTSTQIRPKTELLKTLFKPEGFQNAGNGNGNASKQKLGLMSRTMAVHVRCTS